MLGKAKIKSKCKGDDTSNVLILDTKKIRRVLANSIPVLSIFALIGIISTTILLSSSLTDEAAYAEEDISPLATPETIGDSTASITISGAGREEVVSAGRGSTIYRTHSISMAGSNIRNYTLSIYGDSNLRYVGSSDILTSANGKAGSNIDTNTWGYGYGDSTASNDNLTYKAPTGSTIGTAETLASGTVASSDNGVLSISNKKLVFAAKFDEDKPSGNYRANVNLALTITPRVLTTYSITYSGNGNTSGTVPAKQSIDLYDTTSYNGFIAAANTGNLTKTGYNFLGWSESSTATTATYTAGSSTVSLTSSKPEITLYAVWEKRVLTLKDITKMQEMTADICKASSVGDTNTLTDTRDNNTYTIRKHEDNNCWMTQNLRIVGETITSENSDVDSDFSIPESNIQSFVNSNNVNGAYYDNNTNYGSYYTWYTATAGTGTSSVSTGEAKSSICPKGWRLPSQPNYSNLASAIGAGNNAAGSSLFRNSTYKFQLSGDVFIRQLLYTGTYGFYWSRTAFSATNTYVLWLVNNTANPAYKDQYSSKYFGFSVRCVAY